MTSFSFETGKSLHLTIFPYDNDRGGYVLQTTIYGQRYEYLVPETLAEWDAQKKRLTAPELAAEYWSAEKALGDIRGIGGGYLVLEPEMYEQVLTLHRFATTAHFDED